MKTQAPVSTTRSQLRAFVFKSFALQRRQKWTNICQVALPALVMVELIAFSVLFGAGFHISFFRPVSWFSPSINATFSCEVDQPQVIRNSTEMCGAWQHLYFSNPANTQQDGVAGELTSTGQRSGLLGQIPQLRYTPDGQLVPFYDQYNSADDIDTEILKQISDQQTSDNMTDSEKKQMPTGAVNFQRVLLNGGAGAENIQLHYEIQVNTKNAGLMYPNRSLSDAGAEGVTIMASLHSAVASAALNDNVTITATTASMPYTQYMASIDMGSVMGAIYIPTALGVILPVFVYTLVLEKSTKVYIMQKIYGMHPIKYQAVTYVFDFAIYSVIAIGVTGISIFAGIGVMWKTNPIIYVLLFILWGTSQVSMAFFLATFFKSPRTAKIVSYLLGIFGVTLPAEINLLLIPNVNTTGLGYFAYLCLPQAAFTRGFWILCARSFEPLLEPMSLTEMFVHPLNSFNICLYYLLAQSIILLLLANYLNEVLPHEFGVAKPLLYPLYDLQERFCKRKEPSQFDDLESTPLIQDEMDEDSDVRLERQHANDPNYQCKMRVVNMRKVYATGAGSDEKVALKNLCLTMKDGETFGLLGPNGAGKSTLVNTLVGLQTPTSGHAMINGFRVPEQMDGVYRSLGYVAQYDFGLWDDLTVTEHLLFYCRLRGIDETKEETHVKELIRRVRLQTSTDKAVSTLSGGTKRRLSLAIALIGSPSVVLLDEPTTGLDPVSKHAVWEIINEEKRNRVTVLCTHDLHEADVLCSRVGIMAHGVLKCVGTQQTLKNRYGAGYTLTLTVTDAVKADSFIHQLYPAAQRKQTSSRVVTYEVPTKDVSLPALFASMKFKEQHGIEEFGCSQTSLEDAFLSIVNASEDDSGY